MSSKHVARRVTRRTSMLSVGVAVAVVMPAAISHAVALDGPTRTMLAASAAHGERQGINADFGGPVGSSPVRPVGAEASISANDATNQLLMSVANLSPKTEYNHAGTMKFDTFHSSQIFAPGQGSQIEVEQLDQISASSYGYSQAARVKLYIMTDPTEGPQDPENYGFFADLIVGRDSSGSLSLLIKGYGQEVRLTVTQTQTYVLKMPQERGWPNPDFPMTIKFTGTKDLGKDHTLAMLSVSADWRTPAHQ